MDECRRVFQHRGQCHLFQCADSQLRASKAAHNDFICPVASPLAVGHIQYQFRRMHQYIATVLLIRVDGMYPLAAILLKIHQKTRRRKTDIVDVSSGGIVHYVVVGDAHRQTAAAIMMGNRQNLQGGEVRRHEAALILLEELLHVQGNKTVDTLEIREVRRVAEEDLRAEGEGIASRLGGGHKVADYSQLGYFQLPKRVERRRQAVGNGHHQKAGGVVAFSKDWQIFWKGTIISYRITREYRGYFLQGSGPGYLFV